MDRDYLSTQIAEALGSAQAIVEAEHKLINDGQLEVGMKRQLQQIHDEDEENVKNLEKALETVGRTSDTDKSIQKGKESCERIVSMSGDDPLEVLKATILAKYKLADSQELFYNLCEEIGHEDLCDLFETSLEDEEDHLDYMREQAILIARERITGVSATR